MPLIISNVEGKVNFCNNYNNKTILYQVLHLCAKLTSFKTKGQKLEAAETSLKCES